MGEWTFFLFSIVFALAVIVAAQLIHPPAVNSPAELEAWRQSLSPSVLRDMP